MSNTAEPMWPPLFEGYAKEYVNWKPIGDVDVSVIGHLLFCHLILEHYVEQYLIAETAGQFSFDASRLSFGQKISLLGSHEPIREFNFLPALRHFNKLRNAQAHRVAVQFTTEDLQPIIAFLEAQTKAAGLASQTQQQILDTFVGMVCAWFAARIGRRCPGGSGDIRREFEWWIFCSDPDRGA